MLDALAGSELHVDGHRLIVVVVSLELASQVLGDQRQRPLPVGVVVVETQVKSSRNGVVVADIRRHHAGGDASRQAVGKQIGKGGGEGKVLGGELASLHVARIGAPHRAIVDVLRPETQ